MSTNPPDQGSSRPGTARSKFRTWWVVSVVFHGVLFTWICFFSPVRVIDLSKKAADTVGPAEVRKVSEEIRDRQKKEFVDKVRKLEETKKELEKLEDRKREQFREFARDVTNNTPRLPPATPEQLAALRDAMAGSHTNASAATGSNALSAATNQIARNQEALTTGRTNAFVARNNPPSTLTNDLGVIAGQIAQIQAAAAQAQREAKAAQTNANNVIANAARDGKPDGLNDAAHPQEQVKTAQDNAREAQNRALDALAAGNTNLDAAYHAQIEAGTLQEEAAQAQLQANAARQLAQDAHNNPKRSRQRAALQKAADFQARAAGLQDQAQQAQAEAGQALAAAAAGNGAPTGHADTPNLNAMNMEQLYQHAEQTEAQTAESYRRLRATELAMLRQIPLSRAMGLTETTMTEHPALHNELQNIETNTGDVSALAAAVNAANAEVGAMNHLGNSLLAQAQALDKNGSQSEGGASVTLDDIKAEAAHEAAMENAANADGNQRTMDMSGMMQAGARGYSFGHGTAAAQGTTTAESGSFTDSYRNGNARDTGGAGANAPSIPPKREISPGRVVAETGDSKKFLFLDSWYIIGPFDNTGRANIDKKFPPETIVDLNATYPGKHGYPIRWEFYQAAQPQVTPPFEHYNYFDNLPASQRHDARYHDLEQIVYYAYTELRFETDCDLWLAIGSDDYSKLWINDQQVWTSGKALQAWSADQGFRKVHFNKGVNRILYRVENGNARTDFSLVICLPH